MQKLFIFLQHLVPQHALSRLVAVFAGSSLALIKTPFIRLFIRRYKVDMSEAMVSDVSHFRSFNDFFTRQLKDGARPTNPLHGGIVSPADGTISEMGRITAGQMLQAKGRTYSCVELLGGEPDEARPFLDGSFVTVYLSPRDYHRVHMPISGKLLKTIYIPGRLFSVNQATANSVPGLFARNERLVCLFETEIGRVALVLVGAMIVAGIETVWSGRVCPNAHGMKKQSFLDRTPPVQLVKGAEMGRFFLGSTVIMLFEPGAVLFNTDFGSTSKIKLGELLATTTPNSPRHD